MALLLLHRSSGLITLEPGSIDQYAHNHGFDVLPAILDGEDCVQLLRGTNWVATASSIDL